MAESGVEFPGVVVDISELIVSNRQFSNGICREHFERLRVTVLRLCKVTKALFGRPAGLLGVKESYVSDRAQLSKAPGPAHAIFFRVQLEAALIPPLGEGQITDCVYVPISLTQVECRDCSSLYVSDLLHKR
jgi:hypothetical protein